MSGGVDPDWWPSLLHWHAEAAADVGGRVHLALVENDYDQSTYRHVYAAIGDLEVARRLVSTPGFQGHDADSNGPHPTVGVGEYEPRFWVFTDGNEFFEPLAIRWQSGGREVVLPDQGILMTYGLVPRYTQDQRVHWDDPQAPKHDLIVAHTSISTMYDESGEAFVEADAQLVQDYGSLRGLSVVQVYYAQSRGEPDAEMAQRLGSAGDVELHLPGRTIRIQETRPGEVMAECWGIRLICEPGNLPITEGRLDYGSLEWPGIGALEGKNAYRALRGQDRDVYVRDTVLARFEGHSDIDIHPESGAVSYRNQWSVSPSKRIGRDLIRIDLKKLYEGCPPDIVRHYHSHAVGVENPVGTSGANVATRSRRIAVAIARLGAHLAWLSDLLSLEAEAHDFVGVSQAELEYCGWWSDDEFEAIARHIPSALTQDRFLDRCASLLKATADRFGERQLRRLVHGLGIDPGSVAEYKSLKLLEAIIGIIGIASEGGLHLLRDSDEIVRRFQEAAPGSKLSPLFRLNELRIAATHAVGNRRERVVSVLEEFGVASASLAAGYEGALESVYDAVAEAVESCVALLQDAQRSMT